MEYLKGLVVDVIRDYLEEEMSEDVFDHMNNASNFAYLTIHSYLEGPNKDSRLFVEDVRVVLETDPITGLYLIYLVRGNDATPDQRVRVTKLASYDGFEILLTADIFDIETRIAPLVDKLQEEVDEKFIQNENFYVHSYKEACDFLTTEELAEMRLEFGFDAPVNDNDSDDSSNDLDDSSYDDYQGEDQDERRFSDNLWEIRDWMRETKSYENWSGRALDSIIVDMHNYGRIRDVVFDELHLGSLVVEFHDIFGTEMRGPAILEWKDSSLRIWEDQEDPDDLPPDDVDPDRIYSASADSFLRFDNSIRVENFYDTGRSGSAYIRFKDKRFLFIDTQYLYLKTPVSRLVQKEIGLLTFLNPEAHLKLFIYLSIWTNKRLDENMNIKNMIKSLFDKKETGHPEVDEVISFFTSLKTPHCLNLQAGKNIF